MLVCLDDGLIKSFKKTTLNDFSKEIKAIENLMKLVYDQKHMFYASPELVETLSKVNLSKFALRLLKNYENNWPTLASIKNKVEYKIVVVENKDNKDTNNRKIFYYDLNDLLKLESSYLAVEDLRDGYFYFSVFNTYYSDSLDLPFYMRSISYSGSQAYNNLENLILDKIPPILIISDTDKNYKDDKHGSSYKDAKKFYKEYQNSVIHSLDCREKENLIPYYVYLRLLLNTKSDIPPYLILLATYELTNTFTGLIEFFNIKDGISYKNLKNIYINYSHNQEFIHLIKKILVCSFKETNHDFNMYNKEDLKRKIIKGVGDFTFEKFSKFLFGNFKKVNRNNCEIRIKNYNDYAFVDIDKSDFSEDILKLRKDLIDYCMLVRKDYKDIFKLIYNFGFSYNLSSL